MINEKEILEIIKDANFAVKADELKLDIKLSDQGIDSLDRTSLYFEIEEKFGVKMPIEDEPKYQTILQIVSYVNAQK